LTTSLRPLRWYLISLTQRISKYKGFINKVGRSRGEARELEGRSKFPGKGGALLSFQRVGKKLVHLAKKDSSRGGKEERGRGLWYEVRGSVLNEEEDMSPLHQSAARIM